MDPVETRPGLLVDYRQTITRHRKLILMLTSAAGVISVACSLLLPNIYNAKAMIFPLQEDKGFANAMLSQAAGLAVLAGGAIGGSSTADLYVTMLKSETIKDPIITRFKLMDIYHKKNLSRTYAVLDKKTSLSIGRKDGVVSISVEDKDPQRAAALANAYVEELQNLTVGLNMTGAGRNRSFLEERLVQAKADLARAEGNLKTFQGKNKAINVTEQAKATIEGVAGLQAQLALYQVQLATARRQFTESSQEVKNLKASIVNLQSQIAQLEGSGGSSAIPSVGSMPALGEQYVRLMRELKLQESLVELLTKQFEMARFSEAKNISPFQVLQKAKVPDEKIKPKRGFIIVMATFTAFLCSVVGALVVDRFNLLSNGNVLH